VKTPKRIKKTSQEIIDEEEAFFNSMDVRNPIVLAYAFGRYLNMFFAPWNPSDDVWIDADHYAYTTREILADFLRTYRHNKS
jgi:hypothetical protein